MQNQEIKAGDKVRLGANNAAPKMIVSEIDHNALAHCFMYNHVSGSIENHHLPISVLKKV